ncbi:hypothetical protein [Saccharothrix australiensis]|uniref:DUF3558 domain-containing protein n=1 Tax=Saccharothrix australiensis TaxID=2072 RepID=A0A495VXH8_9PSEU|nr:hypothetical protein [Saccharothrix australiensis]RKT53085.1 hypothetical protein C8E97_1635 [Saccharothrix australiensis]
MTIRMALVAACGLALLGGCTPAPASAPAPSSGPSPAPTTTATEVAGISCADAPEEVVGAALRLNLAHPRETIDGAEVRCRYAGGGAETSVRFRAGVDAGAFARGRETFARGARRVADLAGFHDEAYTGTLGTGEVVQNTLVARKGTVEITVTSGANFEQEKQLVTELFGRL